MRSRTLKFAVCAMIILIIMLQQAGIFKKNITTDDGVSLVQTLPFPTPPIHIAIPAIEVDQDIVEYSDEMVVTSDNSVHPVYSNDVAWWSGGGRPGTTFDNTSDDKSKIDFTTFLYGHSTNNQVKIIFDDIDLLKSGDEIFITTEFGQTIYIVDEVFIVKKTDFTTDRRVVDDTPGRLLLISCWRAWAGSETTTDNVVVVAKLLDFTN